MKRLFVALLFLAAATAPWRATATDVCPSDSLSGSVIITTNQANTTYTADGCGIGASASIVFESSGIPQGVVANRATVELINSNIARNAVVLFNLPTSNSNSGRLIPLTISVKGNTFAALSQLQFGSGALPPQSSIIIESNVWEKLQQLTPNPTSRLLQFGSLAILQNVTLAIHSNVFAMNELTNGTNIAGVTLSAINIGLGSTVSISKNTFDMEGFMRRDCYGIHGNAVTITMKSDSKLIVDDNTFSIVNGLAWVFPRIDFDSANGVRTTFSIQRNTLNMQSGNGHQFAYHQETKGNTMTSNIKDNVMTCVGCSGKWEWTRNLQFGPTVFDMASNKMTVTGGGVPQIIFTYIEMELATLSIADNLLTATDQVLNSKNPWLDFGSGSLRKGCSILVLRNTFDAVYMPTRPAINTATTASSFQVERTGTTRVFICGNDFFGTKPFSNDYVALYMTSLLAAQLRPEQECAQLYLPYNATYEPMDNAAPQSQTPTGLALMILVSAMLTVLSGMLA